MKNLIFAALLLTSCGQDNSSSGGAPAPQTEASKPSEKTPTPTPATKGEREITSYYVLRASELRQCDLEAEGMLAYVSESKTFQACLEGAWTVVDVRGKDGQAGRDGSNGSDGKNAYANDNTWFDAATGKMWLVGGNVHYSYAYATSACPSGYSMPSVQAAQSAVMNGLMNVVQRLNNRAAIYAERTAQDAAQLKVAYVDSSGFTATKTFDSPTIPALALVCLKN